jgi:hypothetical protein
MKLSLPQTLNAEFVVDNKGNKKKIILDMDQFQELVDLLQDYYDLAKIAVSKKGAKTYTLEEVEKSLLKKAKR